MNRNTTVYGLSLPSAVMIVFIVLKLCGVIAWSWWWVLSPLWISYAIAIIVLIIIGLIYLIYVVKYGERRRW